MEFYPLRFEPVYKEKIWGGTKLKEVFNRSLPSSNIGESWEVAAHPNGTSIVKNGYWKGKKFTCLLEHYPEEMMGRSYKNKKDSKFPLLIKLLDANKKLSVQVHPDDEYAMKVEGEQGKTEMWYIIKAKPGAKLVYGLKPGTTREILAKAIDEGNLEDYLREVEVKEGDIFFMPSGTVHAIEEGILLAEIQQNSDTTYRVYDWNRLGQDGKPRPLHIQQALEVINFDEENIKDRYKPLSHQEKGYTQHILAACPYFVTEQINLKEKYTLNPQGERFYTIMVLDGKGELIYTQKSYSLKPGQTYFLPAILDEVTMKGKMKFLVSYLPQAKGEFIGNLERMGFEREEIGKLAGIKEWN